VTNLVLARGLGVRGGTQVRDGVEGRAWRFGDREQEGLLALSRRRENGGTRGDGKSARRQRRRVPRATLAHEWRIGGGEFIGVRYLLGGAERGESRVVTDRRCHREVAIIESLTTRGSALERIDYGESEGQY